MDSIWELGIAVKTSTGLETRISLGDQLIELGYMMRKVRDALIRINSLGVNSFSWVLRRVNISAQLIRNNLIMHFF
jgi:hypothetical protein